MNLSVQPLKGKKALITGATGGIGRAIVQALVDAGADVIAHGKDQNRLDKLHDEIPELQIEKADLRIVSDVEHLAANSLSKHGSLDILVNNAGVGFHSNVIDQDIAEYEDMMNINLRAVFILCKIIGKSMASRGSGYIINIGSGASTTPIAGLATYCASKHGLLGFSESLGLELRDSGVKVTIIMPGSTVSRFAGNDPAKRLKAKPGILLPEDIADTVMYLLKQPKRAWTSQVNLRPLTPNKAV